MGKGNFHFRANIDESSGLGKVEIAAPTHIAIDLFEHGLGGSRHFQAAEVKRRGEERVLSHVDQVSAGQVSSERDATVNSFPLASLQGNPSHFTLLLAPTTAPR